MPRLFELVVLNFTTGEIPYDNTPPRGQLPTNPFAYRISPGKNHASRRSLTPSDIAERVLHSFFSIADKTMSSLTAND